MCSGTAPSGRQKHNLGAVTWVPITSLNEGRAWKYTRKDTEWERERGKHGTWEKRMKYEGKTETKSNKKDWKEMKIFKKNQRRGILQRSQKMGN